MKRLTLTMLLLSFIVISSAMDKKDKILPQEKQTKTISIEKTKADIDKDVYISNNIISPEDYPIDMDVKVSKKTILVNDSIEINIRIKLLRNHPNYKKGMKFVIMNQNYTGIHDFIKIGVPPEILAKKTCPALRSYWKILYSDDDKIIDENNIEESFTFRIKLVKKPERENLSLPIRVLYFEKIMEYGNLKDYTLNNGARTSYEKNIELDCIEPGLKYIKKKYGDVFKTDKHFKISHELSKPHKFKNPPIKELKKTKGIQ